MVAQITNISLGRMRRQHYRLMLLYHIKNEKTCEGEEWELIWTRYEELKELFIERYPNSDEFEVDPEEFPNCKDTSIFSKEKINAKLSKIKFGYRKAVDSGRWSQWPCKGGWNCQGCSWKNCWCKKKLNF